jgi:hypothetical protein
MKNHPVSKTPLIHGQLLANGFWLACDRRRVDALWKVRDMADRVPVRERLERHTDGNEWKVHERPQLRPLLEAARQRELHLLQQFGENIFRGEIELTGLPFPAPTDGARERIPAALGRTLRLNIDRSFAWDGLHEEYRDGDRCWREVKVYLRGFSSHEVAAGRPSTAPITSERSSLKATPPIADTPRDDAELAAGSQPDKQQVGIKRQVHDAAEKILAKGLVRPVRGSKKTLVTLLKLNPQFADYPAETLDRYATDAHRDWNAEERKHRAD